jgi:hypothetical protein
LPSQFSWEFIILRNECSWSKVSSEENALALLKSIAIGNALFSFANQGSIGRGVALHIVWQMGHLNVVAFPAPKLAATPLLLFAADA